VPVRAARRACLGRRNPVSFRALERTGFCCPSSHRLRAPHLAAALALCGACGGADARAGAPAAAAITLTDDAGQTVTLAGPARRVVSLIPSANETLRALGAGGHAGGAHRLRPRAGLAPLRGGGLDPSLEKLASLRPDLVIGWETHKPQVRERLRELGIPVFAVRTEDTTDVFRAIRNLGRLTGRAPAADSLAARLRGEIEAVRASVAGLPRPSVFFVVWNDPPMTAGPTTFIAQMIEVAGGRTVFPDATQPWPTVSMEEVVRRQPDVVVLPVGESGSPKADVRAPGWRDLRALQGRGPVLVDADLVNRPGPRLGEAARRCATRCTRSGRAGEALRPPPPSRRGRRGRAPGGGAHGRRAAERARRPRRIRGTGDPTTIAIVQRLRLPRAVLAALVGGALAASGAVFQALLRNPLAEPYVLGVSGGAAVGAVGAIVLAGAPVSGAGGGALRLRGRGGWRSFWCSGWRPSVGQALDTRVLLLAGVVVGAFFNACILLALTFADAENFRSAMFWMMGSFSGATWRGIGTLAGVMAPALLLLFALARPLNLFAVGEDTAAFLGVRTERTKILAYGTASS
jgi:ABC-type Fe3+-hydroxamate transport system substrate-binding protein